MEITYDEVTKLLEAIDGASRLDQFDIAIGGFRVQVERGGASTERRRSPSTVEGNVAPGATRGAGSPSDEIIIRAPMLGRFFRAGPTRDGSFCVAADNVVGLIKVGAQSTDIKAGANGVAICVAENGRLVEYGQEIFTVVPDPGAE